MKLFFANQLAIGFNVSLFPLVCSCNDRIFRANLIDLILTHHAQCHLLNHQAFPFSQHTICHRSSPLHSPIRNCNALLYFSCRFTSFMVTLGRRERLLLSIRSEIFTAVATGFAFTRQR